jgi:hypothetical protein
VQLIILCFAFDVLFFDLKLNQQTRNVEIVPETRAQLSDPRNAVWMVQLFFLSVCPVSALFLLSTARWHIDQTCTKLEVLLQRTSSRLESSKGNVLDKDVCNGEDSLGVLLAFCKAPSENALQMFGLSMDFMSLMRYMALSLRRLSSLRAHQIVIVRGFVALENVNALLCCALK